MVSTGPTCFTQGADFWKQALKKEKETLKEHKDLTGLMTGQGQTFTDMGKSFNAILHLQKTMPKTGSNLWPQARGYYGN
jgi:hypothetical protein